MPKKKRTPSLHSTFISVYVDHMLCLNLFDLSSHRNSSEVHSRHFALLKHKPKTHSLLQNGSLSTHRSDS